MFSVPDVEAATIRAAYEQRGELTAVVEPHRRVPGIDSTAQARECDRGWKSRARLPMALTRQRKLNFSSPTKHLTDCYRSGTSVHRLTTARASASKPVARWLAQSSGRAPGVGAMLTDDRKIVASQSLPNR